WRVVLAADRLEHSGARTACAHAFYFGQHAVRAALIVDDRVLDLVSLKVEMTAFRHHRCLFRHALLLWLARWHVRIDFVSTQPLRQLLVEQRVELNPDLVLLGTRDVAEGAFALRLHR